MNKNDDGITFSEVDEILRVIDQFPAAEVIYERGDLKLHVRRAGAGPAASLAAAPAAASAPAPAAPAANQDSKGAAGKASGGTTLAAPAAAQDRAGLLAVTSPLMGAFYAAPAPDAAPFVKVGQRVAPGDDLCIIDVMKVMNLVKSEVAGTVVAIDAVNANLVERGQPLMWIREDSRA